MTFDHYSYSSLSLFDQCPYSFYLQYVEKNPCASNAYAESGTLTHDIINKWARHVIAETELVNEFESRWPDEVVTYFPPFPKNITEITFNKIKSYFEQFDCFDGYEILSSEKRYSTTIADRKFIGVVDMVLRNKETDDLIILDHKSKSLSSFKKEENSMYRQQYLYSKFIKEEYGKFPNILMFNLFKEDGLRPERAFNESEYNSTIEWAENTIQKIESFDILNWLETKSQDFFCTEICSMRKVCPNGFRK